MPPSIIGLITARGGSRGLPRKNVLPVAGKPLIAWTVEAALASGALTRVLLSTDDEEIADAARNVGAEVPFMRPSEIAQDDSPHILAALHALDWLEANSSGPPDALCLLQPTSPLRSAQDISNAVTLWTTRRPAAVVSVSQSSEAPYLCTVDQDSLTIRPGRPWNAGYQRRQDFKPLQYRNGAIHVNSTHSLRTENTFFPVDMLAYQMPLERSLDIDTAWDLHRADLLLATIAPRTGPDQRSV